MKRGLEEAKGILESLGHEFVSIELPDFDVINELLTSLYGNSTPKKTGEPPLNSFILNKPRSFWSRLKNKFTRKNKESFYYKAIGLKSGYEYVQNLIRVTKLKNQFIKEWTDLGIDVIITPFPTPAIKHDLSEQLYPAFAYVTFFNLLDCPAGSVPITVVKENEQFYPETAEGWTKVMHKNMEHSKDLPVCIQVISPPYKEELCLNVMRQLNEKNPFWKKCNFST